jgi:mRNA interferase MazF
VTDFARGELWWATLDPIVGSEQGGRRPVLVPQNDAVSSFTRTVIAIPLTTNLRRSQLPSAVFVPSAGTGLQSDSVALCHQARVLDKSRLHQRIGMLPDDLLHQVEYAVLFTLGILPPTNRTPG